MMVEEEMKEKIWDPAFPKCPKCGYPLAQPPKCIHCGEKIEEPPEEPEKPKGPETLEGGTPEDKKSEEPEDLSELLTKPREELDTIATEKGIDPGEYPKKRELAKAISEKGS